MDSRRSRKRYICRSETNSLPSRRRRRRKALVRTLLGSFGETLLERLLALGGSSRRALTGAARAAGARWAGTTAVARRYAPQLTALAGIVIVIMSVYLIRQGTLVPSTYRLGPDNRPPATASADPASGDQRPDGGSTSTATGPAETPPAPASGVVVPVSVPEAVVPTPPAESEAAVTVIDLEGQSAQPSGPLSLEDCLRTMVSPATGTIVRQRGFYESALFREWRYHTGVDIALKTGDPIHAAQEGIVHGAELTAAEAWRVEIAHGFGVATVYAHLGAVEVRVGDFVRAGQRIATAGPPGDLECDLGVHLHFELRIDGRDADPGPVVGP